MNARIDTVFVIVVTLGLVLSIGILTTIHSQPAFTLIDTNTGINGGTCTTDHCNTSGVNSTGGQGGGSGGTNG